ncbi:thioesterase family protein [Euzebya rosea]|uniref:thioesterase family protein n=1 Tax=Euzebya rosea TaxID=2052804 RepID=UPI00130090DD|nr:thioesterase family protein [Euzebya rosea]
MTADAFFTTIDDRIPDGDRPGGARPSSGPAGRDAAILVVAANEIAVGPWDPGALHAGPPSALLHAAMRRHHDPEGRITTRVSYEILRPVPLGRLSVRTHVQRPGRKVELVAAELADDDGTVVMTAAEWRIRTTPLDLGVGIEGEPMPGPDGLPASVGFFKQVPEGGYVSTMESRFVEGGWEVPGPARAWMRMPVRLLDDEDLTGVDRLLVSADSGNGVSARSGPGTALGEDGLFVNVDLTVHLTREPRGEWIGLDAHTVLTDHGVGHAHSVLHDLDGPVGRASQSLIVDRPG